MRPIALAALMLVAIAWGGVCEERPSNLHLAAKTPLWLKFPDSAKQRPDLRVTDSTQRWIVLGCRKGWLHLKDAKGRELWTKVSSAAKKRGKSVVADRENAASDGLLGEEVGDSEVVVGILAGGGGSFGKAARGGRGSSGDGDRMAGVGVGGVGLGAAGRADGGSTVHRFTPFSGASMDLGGGKIDGYLDNPQAVYVLSEGGASAGADFDGSAAPAAAKATIAPVVAAAAPSLRKPSGLQAGVSDDNRQFPAFLEFLRAKGSAASHLDTRVQERIRIHVTDSAGHGVVGARISVLEGSTSLEELRTLADGSALLFPRWLDSVGTLPPLRLRLETPSGFFDRPIFPDGPRDVDLPMPGSRSVQGALPVDLLFVLDVTGSMQAQIDQLKNAISILQINLSSLSAKVRLRFGLVQYRDRGDDFLVRTIPFTQDAEAFSKALSGVQADGGGDTPEDLQSALDTAVRAMDWNRDGIRLGFVVTDAPPHLDYGESFTYARAAHLARQRGIKIHTVGCGTLPLGGEIVLRQIAQATGGKYVFLTSKGERGENDGGAPGAVSHHTGDNWVSERLETALLRLSRDEINQQLDVPPLDTSDWYEARPSTTAPRDSVVSALFRQAFQELRDFSSLPLADTVRLAVLPTSAADSGLRAQAAWLGQILSIEASRSGHARVVERGNLGEVLREQALQQSGAMDPASVGGAGRLLGAEVLLLSGLHRRGDRQELVLKLVRTSTGELLSATRAKIDTALLP